MKRCVLVLLLLVACRSSEPVERYGFLTRLGDDTISVESVTRTGNTETSDAVDRFPRVRVRHTDIQLEPDGAIRHLAMQIYTPSAPANNAAERRGRRDEGFRSRIEDRQHRHAAPRVRDPKAGRRWRMSRRCTASMSSTSRRP